MICLLTKFIAFPNIRLVANDHQKPARRERGEKVGVHIMKLLRTPKEIDRKGVVVFNCSGYLKKF